jgi:hypothetical protein
MIVTRLIVTGWTALRDFSCSDIAHIRYLLRLPLSCVCFPQDERLFPKESRHSLNHDQQYSRTFVLFSSWTRVLFVSVFGPAVHLHSNNETRKLSKATCDISGASLCCRTCLTKESNNLQHLWQNHLKDMNVYSLFGNDFRALLNIIWSMSNSRSHGIFLPVSLQTFHLNGHHSY